MCLYPKIITNKKYTANKKNKGVVPIVKDNRTLLVPIGCGKCMECKKQKSREWAVRLHEEIRENRNGKFVTMSYGEKEIENLNKEIGQEASITGYERDNEIARISIRRYLERWRKEYGVSVRHWLVTELGGKRTERLHIHGIIWTDKEKEIERIWKYGNVWIGEYVNGRTVNYIVKYISKIDEIHKEYNSKIFSSSGIGAGYIRRPDSELNKYKIIGETKETYTTRQGIKLALPIYYRNYIYNDDEKEKLWIKKLDKEERWVNGEMISIKNGDEEYYKKLEYEREKNKRLKYGDDEKNWERMKYEAQRRIIKIQERIKRLRREEEKEIIRRSKIEWIKVKGRIIEKPA